MIEEKKVFILQFKEDGVVVPTEYIFGSIGAIFEQYSATTIGAVIGTVYNSTSKTGKYDGEKAVIRKDTMKVMKRTRSSL